MSSPSIYNILEYIEQVSKLYGTSRPYIVGGLPRDMFMGRMSNISDVDITTGDITIDALAIGCNRFFNSKGFSGVTFETFPDGHSQMTVEGVKIDFSSNFLSKNALPLLKKAGKDKPEPMLIELLSRDFNCNTLLTDLSLKNVYDSTGMGIYDIEKKVLRTPLPPSITLSENIRRIPRVYYLAAKLGFSVEPKIIDFIRDNKYLLMSINKKYLNNKISEAIGYDRERTLSLIEATEIYDYIEVNI